ncbi:16S rRNA (cytidine(1402)-2'-O)-methyltransferase [Candidatus Woesebacteria bacterium RIFCSPHIGHO2_01_FULL_44_10]|uniref:16S rRNA (Cytidine(1402)-2'-O)-methyltransferase n=1 Tax=Candidatus Woesebacteria bacterium RIFCSPLOWO2_01_FULL_44_14 TaxID=1802525 RepID=A0A1F8C3Y9_9BACT|nr:MAG: 16S rRNA (cytidine(1402)-2'-O)-methyltransferase [Candidatus Woesebacteria bacterium RIFCSPHIGHO2_01_FULL_44_10]OGM54514.1 MAG: 16S rRNA (cytidine(1402)-2'-O)-methyltransferase [Candidatus Woesebacteria bacterium RIFCSPHIGHO2_12_FULL_44_11]OGM70408.1 MAG: 16S rRNA (cytidine(1402)-2'-O)-methyltransferase [Candidatus Woesebacteria bacterium RIFCSPLOWO2_01_FULL_44_14]
MEDLSARAIRTLNEADLVLAEDTRVTKKLGIKTKVIAYHQHSSEAKKLEILNYLLQGKNLALVTDAGTPGVSDPGNELIDFLFLRGPTLKVVPIPGPSAVTAALSVCGFNVSKYIFLGFWPKKKVTKLIELIKLTKLPIVFFESPHRIIKTLNLLIENFGGTRRAFVAREMTKMYETYYRGSLLEVSQQLQGLSLKGELTVVIESQLPQVR